jgi:hypothetical protein
MSSFTFILASVLIAQNPSVESALKKHEEGLRAIHSLSMELSSRRSADDGKTWTPVSDSRWKRSGQRERLQTHSFGSSFNGVWQSGESFRVMASDSTEMRLLDGVDLEGLTLRKVNPVDQPRIHAVISIPTPLGPHGRSSVSSEMLLFTFGGHGLREVVGHSLSNPVALGSDELGFTWDLTVDGHDGFHYKICLSPEHHLAVSKVETDYSGNSATGIRPYRRTDQVASFHDDPAGFSIPTLIRTTETYDIGKKSAERFLRELVVTIGSINAPIPDKDLALDFPTGIDVNDGVRSLFHVWGDGKPEQSFRSGPELMTWRRQTIAAIRSARRNQSLFSSPMMFAFYGLTALLVVLFAWRRWRSSEGGSGGLGLAHTS